MRMIVKAAIGALALASAGAMVSTPANARGPYVGFSIGVGPAYGYYDPYYRPYPYPYYYGPAYYYPYGYAYGPSIGFRFGGGHHRHWRR